MILYKRGWALLRSIPSFKWSHDITQRHMTLPNVTWHYPMSHDIKPCHMTPHNVTWHYPMSHDIKQCHMTSHNVTWQHTMSHDITHDTTQCHMTPQNVTWHHTMSHDCRDKGVQESKTRKRREERVKKPTAGDDDEWETVTRTGKQLTIQVGGACN